MIDIYLQKCCFIQKSVLGLGEGGVGVEPSAQERGSAEFQRLYRENGFNAFISNNISLDRSVKDIRHPK